jgi:hypothetical protein
MTPAKVMFNITEVLHLFYERATKEVNDINKLMDDELLGQVRSMRDEIFKKNMVKKTWMTPLEYLDTIIALLAKEASFGTLSYKKMGHMGIVFQVQDCGGSRTLHKRKIIGPVCPKAFFIMLLLKVEYPNHEFKSKYSVYEPNGSMTEFIFEPETGSPAGGDLKKNAEQSTCNIDMVEIRKSTKVLIEGLSKRFNKPEDFLTKEFIQTINDINKVVLPNVKFERNWTDHFHFIKELVKENNKQCMLCKAEVERLWNMGIVLSIDATEDQLITDHTCGAKYHPFAIFLAANVKYQFRDLSIKIKPTRYVQGRAETEIVMQ